MAVTDRHRQRVGGIGLRRSGKFNSRVIMCCTCDLSAAPLPDHRLFDGARRVFADRQPRHHHRAQRRATSLAELERRIGIAVHEDLLDRHFHAG
jgi:hypothetical protein